MFDSHGRHDDFESQSLDANLQPSGFNVLHYPVHAEEKTVGHKLSANFERKTHHIIRNNVGNNEFSPWL